LKIFRKDSHPGIEDGESIHDLPAQLWVLFLTEIGQKKVCAEFPLRRLSEQAAAR
jgi:hypothetical protein